MGCSPPGSSVHGILQTRILEWGSCECSQGWRLWLREVVTQSWCHDRRVEQSGNTINDGILLLVYCRMLLAPSSKVQCKRDIMLMQGLSGCFYLFFIFLHLFFFAVIKSVCMEFKPLTYVYPRMGTITVSCRGSVVSCNTQNAVFSLVFPELCFFQSFLQGKLNDLFGAKKRKKEYWSG